MIASLDVFFRSLAFFQGESKHQSELVLNCLVIEDASSGFSTFRSVFPLSCRPRFFDASNVAG